MNVVTIEGDRQSGKTKMAIDIMTRRAKAGDTVAYVARSVTAHEVHRRVESRGEYAHSDHTLGQDRVTYPSGGRILFLSSHADSGRGLVLDMAVMDDGTADNTKAASCYEHAMVAASRPTLVKVLGPSS